ncbi:hypothetical protein SAURM35S_04224 [Streptomyces aurantiogriseus]
MDVEARGTRRPQGNRPLIQERETYFLLVDQGMSFAEAARTVGISTRTGERWRNGRGASGRMAYPPINAASVAEPTDPSRYLREADRVHIADRLLEKATIRAIAAELGRSPSTISREVRRNGTVLADRRRFRAVKNMDAVLAELPALLTLPVGSEFSHTVPGHRPRTSVVPALEAHRAFPPCAAAQDRPAPPQAAHHRCDHRAAPLRRAGHLLRGHYLRRPPAQPGPRPRQARRHHRVRVRCLHRSRPAGSRFLLDRQLVRHTPAHPRRPPPRRGRPGPLPR